MRGSVINLAGLSPAFYALKIIFGFFQEAVHPYQCTHFYQKELMRFEEAYVQWVNERYKHEHNVFEEEQQQLYEHTMVLQEEREQHHQQQEVDVPLEVAEDDDLDPDEENDAVENEEENIVGADQAREDNQQINQTCTYLGHCRDKSKQPSSKTKCP